MVYVAKAESLDPSNPRQGFKTVVPGLYHVQIDDAQMDEKNEQFVNFKLTIVGVAKDGGDMSMIGETHQERIYIYDNNRDMKWADKKFTSIMYCCGLIDEASYKKLVESGNGIPIHFEDMPGRTMVVRLSKRKDKDGKEMQYNEVGLNYFPLDSDEAKLVHLNMNLIDANGNTANDAKTQQAITDDIF